MFTAITAAVAIFLRFPLPPLMRIVAMKMMPFFVQSRQMMKTLVAPGMIQNTKTLTIPVV